MGRYSKKNRGQDWLTLDRFSEKFATATIERFDAHQKRIKGSHVHDRVQRSWRRVYSRDESGNCDMTEIAAEGRKGEVLLMQSNRYARIMRDHVTLVQQTPTMPDPMASNSDPVSQDQVKLGRGICEHYKREFDLEGKKVERSWVAEICGVSYLHVPWDPEAGRERLASPETAEEQGEDNADEGEAESSDEEGAEKPTQRVVYEGDYRFEVRSIYEIAFDRNSRDPKKPRWWIVKSPMNRFDLLELVREEPDENARKALEHAVLNVETWTHFMAELEYEDDSDDEYDDTIAVYYVWGETSRACPEGRQAIVIDKKTVWTDAPLGEPRAPVFRLSQGEVLFRPGEATTANHDGLPLIDALSAQASTILSNSANHGLARVLTPRKANLVQEEIDTGAAAVNYDHVDEAGNAIPPPQIWNPPANNPELYQAYSLFASELDLVMGGSPVTRGDPEATKNDSGSKVAALFAAAQNVGSSFVAEVLRSEEELYTYLIQGLKLHATLPRVITIVGEKNTYETREYLASDLDKIPRVTVGRADPMRDTLAGKLMLVEAIEGKTPEQQKQIVAVMATGRLEPVTDPTEQPRMLMERENEALRTGKEPVYAKAGEPHQEHWLSHDLQERNPEVRKDPMAMARIAAHKAEHVAYLTVGSPVFDEAALLMTGQTPIPLGSLTAQAQAQAQAGGMTAVNPMGAPPPGATTEAPQPGGEPPAPGARPPQGPMPRQPSMPKNPTDGQTMPVSGRPQGAAGRPPAP